MDVFDLQATLGLDSSEYEEGLDSAKKRATSFTSGLKKIGAAAGVALGAATTAVGVLGKKSIDAYANYEQLEGGIKKLYQSASDEIMEYANKAYKTSGLSANQYMEQATSFSAALVNSLDGDFSAAAKQTDVAMRAISDNFNTFGGDINNVQNAFQGFAKQNYTMLDNLKLGYGGTKTEMERLIADANEYAKANGMAADLSINSFSDIVTAIDLIQQKQGIAGTTAKEAATTISGSIGMVKAAYGNLIAGLANPDADISELIKNLVDSIKIAGKNLMPAFEQFAKGFGQALAEIGPIIIKGIPEILSSIVPELINAGAKLLSVFVQTLTSAVPQLFDAGKQLLQTLAKGAGDNSTAFINTGINAVLKFSEFIRNSAKQLIPVALTLIKNLAQGIINNIPTFIATIPVIISNFANVINDNAPKILETGMSILQSLVVGLISAIPVLVENIPKILLAFVDVVKAFGWMALGKSIIKGLVKGLRSAGSLIKSAVTKPISATKAAIIAGFSAAKDKAVSYMQSLKDKIVEKITSVKDKIKNIVNKIKDFFPISVGKIFSGWIPKISLKTKKSGDNATTSSSVGKTKFAKAMQEPYMFKNPTEFYAGEAGDEMLYGHNSLMDDIRNAVGNNSQIIINLNYNASDDATDMVRDIATGVRRYRMAGAL